MRLNLKPLKKTLVICFVGVIFLSLSCSKKSESETSRHSSGEQTPANWKFTLPPGDSASGKQLFVELECYKCHEVKGESLPTVAETEKGIGPELSQMAGMHPAEFFAESIVNPNAVIDPEDKEKGFLGPDGKSRMPTYSEVLTVKQVADLAAYLNSLKRENSKGHH
jgi:mono/diheme cytochrome c family protein